MRRPALLLPSLVSLVVLVAACGVDPEPGAGRVVTHETRVFRARLEIPKFVAALNQYYAVHGEWPEEWSQLRRSALDPWGSEYVFFIEDDRPVVYSCGPDRKPETGDEVWGDQD